MTFKQTESISINLYRKNLSIADKIPINPIILFIANLRYFFSIDKMNPHGTVGLPTML
jgi:hypothetical protein